MREGKRFQGKREGMREIPHKKREGESERKRQLNWGEEIKGVDS